MSSETNFASNNTTGADAVDAVSAQGIDFDGSPIPAAKLELYRQVMALEWPPAQQYHAIAVRIGA